MNIDIIMGTVAGFMVGLFLSVGGTYGVIWFMARKAKEIPA
jgi:hypothetical protein